MEMNIGFGQDSFVKFHEDGHRYVDNENHNYSSVSKLLNSIEEPFDAKAVSMMMATAESKRTGKPKGMIQLRILAEWDKKREDSLDKGNWIHDNLESFHKLGTYDDKLGPVVSKLQSYYSDYYRTYSEVLLFSRKYKIAGQCDLAVQRQRRGGLFDFYDFKTNQARGIEFDTINRKKDPWKHYNRMLLSPLEHLEACNYNRYSLQLSLYALLAEMQYGIKVGKLGILFIDNDLELHKYPVIYMRHAAICMINHSASLKPLPEKKKKEDKFIW